MYHDVYATPDPEVPRSAATYHVSKTAFETQMRIIQESGIRITGPDASRSSGAGRALVVTFDDGWAGTFQNALPLMSRYSFPATVFVTRDFVGRRGFCDASMLRDAAQAGAEIGVHGTTHRMLSALSDQEMLAEFTQCKEFLEQTISKPVRLASLPGGDVNDRIIAAAQKAGLECMCTSNPGINSTNTPAFRLRRIAIRENTDNRAILRFCHLAAGPEVVRWALLETPRRVLGMKNYSRLRRVLIDYRSRGKTREIFRP